MFHVDRVCVYLGPKCNLSCKYCMRDNDNAVTWDFDELSDCFTKYLNNLRKESCRAVIVTGGEPLLYLTRLKKVFSSVDNSIHKKIITNGTLLNEEIVEYCNGSNIEVNISHDGECTEYTRGVDILKNNHILSLIKQINNLTFSVTLSNQNTDIIKIHKYIESFINREVYLTYSVIHNNGHNEFLIDGVDYDTLQKSVLDYSFTKLKYLPVYYKQNRRNKLIGINFNLNGDLIDSTTARYVGRIEYSNEQVLQILDDKFFDECKSRKCRIRDHCCIQKQVASDHNCKVEEIFVNCIAYIDSKNGGLK